MRDPKPFSVFIAQLAEAKRPEYNGPRDLASDAEELCSIARRLHAIHVRQCNGYQRFSVVAGYNVSDDAAEKRDERAEHRFVIRARSLALKCGFDAVYVQRDPRGWPLYLGFAAYMKDNNYSTTGIGVPL